MYKKELEALKRVDRFRERKIFDEDLVDFASNDYLGFSENRKSFKRASKLLLDYKILTPKASILVNGYHEIHQRFEMFLAKLNGFESGLVVGSGFLANISLIEALVRKRDILFIDEEYHASGILATRLLNRSQVIIFNHNDPDDLEEKLNRVEANRKIIAIEGIYSMSGDICREEFFKLANRYNSLLIVDEAHSSGVIGKNLLGVFDYYNIAPKENHIKMGTLGKAYGSYGAYILASSEIISFLENRAKPIIYSTAPSIFDTALALVNVEHISNNTKKYRKKIKDRQKIIKDILGVDLKSLILPLRVQSNEKALKLQEALLVLGFLVGAIRQPTVKSPILRIIPRLGSSKKDLKLLLTHF